ncbi:MAG: PEP-CTERM sorting domain-containing protein [Phycisphaerales bacterium]|nr:PEP-CTERM sorting domain-containing protein [Phycisphaerales bacterium]
MFSSLLLKRLWRNVSPQQSHARGATVLCLGAALMTASSANANVTELFTTQQDFATSGWSGGSALTTAAVATPDSDGATTNGLGNNSAAGGTGTAGALQVTVATLGYDALGGPGENNNSAFLAALAGASTLTADYTLPTGTTTSTFSLQLLFNYPSNYVAISPTSVSATANANGFYTATYTLPAGLPSAPSSGLYYFQLGFILPFDSPVGQTFTIDNIAVSPEPASLGLLVLAGSSMVLLGRRSKPAGRA